MILRSPQRRIKIDFFFTLHTLFFHEILQVLFDKTLLFEIIERYDYNNMSSHSITEGAS